MFYINIQNNDAPKYLYDLIPLTIQMTTGYSLHNGSFIIIPSACRRLHMDHLFLQIFVNGMV
jgi:hypothetical protein